MSAKASSQSTFDVLVGRRIPAQRRRQAALRLERMIAPFGELGNGVLKEEFRWGALASDLPRGRFDAVLAGFDCMRLRGLCPRAAHASKSIRLVLMHQHVHASAQHVLLGERGRYCFHRPPSAGRTVIGLETFFGVLYIVHDQVRAVGPKSEPAARSTSNDCDARRYARADDAILCSSRTRKAKARLPN
jgi:hypothetical protein